MSCVIAAVMESELFQVCGRIASCADSNVMCGTELQNLSETATRTISI